MIYINKVKSRHVIGLLTTFGYHNFGESAGFNARGMFNQYYFALLVNNNTWQPFFFLLGHFIILPVFLFWKDL